MLALVLLAGQALFPRWIESNASFRGAVTVYMTITGLVYAVLLAPIAADVGSYAPWANFTHHNLGPGAIVVDWLLFPPIKKISRRMAWLWLIFPAGYFTFSLIRGAGVNWYPYPFLNPTRVGGYGFVALYAAGIFIVFVVIAMFTRWWADVRGVIPERVGLLPAS